ncbi:hypothetical protein GCM10009641_18810 [Mycobacterium cookii]|uniref:Uncharacterized protein n=1 Tax=Mycobacterium cookii TaxID=1775 RepID=A0A7I7L0L3_9MYCO|nr:AAA family ATPase [Mycobacterium cookii]MCV7332961.1 AAA family ATPase [Mycobacterium cookii]BBX47683.1 hypothetical protein MCOO_36980 [Mycobacterium cookii]
MAAAKSGPTADPITNGSELHDDSGEQRIFREYGPTEWAKPVESLEFLVGKVLCRDTWGPNAGPKKSLKTHDNIAIALAVATKINLYRSQLFAVRHPGKVLYIVGEGGENYIFRTLQRMCRAYDVDPRDVAKDPRFPLVTEFGAAPLDSDRLRDEIKRLLDRHQPVLVLMESFYNFHPAEVNAANLYERGQVIDAYHKLVRAGGEDVVSLLTDHYRSTAGKTLDLDNISMAGQAENADSWITRHHNKTPDVVNGEFSMRVGFGSRQWSGTEWKVDWHLGPFNHDLGCHTGDISWDVAEALPKPDNINSASPRMRFNDDKDLQIHLRHYVSLHPNMTQTAILDALSLDTKLPKKTLKEMWAKAQECGLIVDKSIAREETDPRDSTKRRKVTRRIWFLGQGTPTLAESRQTWGADPLPGATP